MPKPTSLLLTDRQQLVLDFIQDRIDTQGYPPTIREIGEHLGIKSTNGVSDHIKALEKKGFLTREGQKSRTLMPVGAQNDQDEAPPANMIEVPIIGKVAAGTPLLAYENRTGTVHVDSFFLGTSHKVFALRVSGDSMIGDGIFDNDYIFVKKQITAESGDIVVAMIEDEATVKRYYPEGDRIRFQPSNPRLKPIYVHKDEFRDTQILGLVVGVYRKFG